ncbi:MAG: hypothetical protein ACFNUU_04600 [Campylobacter sp.]
MQLEISKSRIKFDGLLAVLNLVFRVKSLKLVKSRDISSNPNRLNLRLL